MKLLIQKQSYIQVFHLYPKKTVYSGLNIVPFMTNSKYKATQITKHDHSCKIASTINCSL